MVSQCCFCALCFFKHLGFLTLFFTRTMFFWHCSFSTMFFQARCFLSFTPNVALCVSFWTLLVTLCLCSTLCVCASFLHYNNRGLFCDPDIIANNKERSFRKPAFTNHNSSQTVKPLRYHNIRTRTIASPSQLPNLIQSQNFYDYNCFYIPFVIKITSKTICNKPIAATI
jgi:hypothetical protein